MYISNEIKWNLQLLCNFKKLVLTHTFDLCDCAVHLAHMAYGLYDITGTRLTFGTDHGSTFVDSS